MNDKAQKVVEAAVSQLGSPYVYGAWGGMCVPSLRRKYLSYHPEHTAIEKTCPVLSGKATDCAECKFDGDRCFDCRGFTHWCLEQVGIDIYGGGATSQYNASKNWLVRGTIMGAMYDCVCCVFQKKGDKMIHTGLHIGGGEVIHCSGEVKRSTLDTSWTHFAVPNGLYTADELAKMGVKKVMQTLRRGSAGEDVSLCQQLLAKAGYNPGDIDGKYGQNTINAVKNFQRDHGLDPDGVCGPLTWAILKDIAPEGARYKMILTGLTWAQVQEVRQKFPLAEVMPE